MKYIFVSGAPGSKWSSVVKNIYYSADIDRTDYSEARTYYHDAGDTGVKDLMHLGAYFDPGMEFPLPESMPTLSKEQAEELIDLGNSREIAEGFGMMRVIEAINHLIEIDDERATDGEIIDLIYELINN